VTNQFLNDAWQVLVLYCVPIGGGIPAGVVVANNKGLGWPIMMIIYFISDIMLACVFDPIVYFLRKHPRTQKFKEAYKKSLQKTVLKDGTKLRPFTLIMIAFGIDPMTGRLATILSGHGFLTGWALTIAGDMIFFTVVMASTLWLNNILGNGTWTAVIITVAILVVPNLIRKIRRKG
jgi:hypothetical protein